MPRGYPQNRPVLLTRITPTYVDELRKAYTYLGLYAEHLRSNRNKVRSMVGNNALTETTTMLINDVYAVRKRLHQKIRRAQKKLQQELANGRTTVGK